MNQTWQTICCVLHVPRRHQLFWSIQNARECFVLFIRPFFLLVPILIANLMNITKKLCYLHDMVNCLNKHIAWLSLLVAVLCYHFEVTKSTKMNVLHASFFSSDGNVAVSMVRNWLTFLSAFNTLGIIDSNQHDLPASRCNVIGELLTWNAHVIPTKFAH